jgi:hypothetical protein
MYKRAIKICSTFSSAMQKIIMENNPPAYSIRQLILYFSKLGTTGFGGPVALVGYMHKDLVENRKWISEEEYKQGLAFAQLAPGEILSGASLPKDDLCLSCSQFLTGE